MEGQIKDGRMNILWNEDNSDKEEHGHGMRLTWTWNEINVDME
jgi:hypothetical protein